MLVSRLQRGTAQFAWWSCLLICLLVFAVGCGGKRRAAEHTEVSGEVTYKGKPLPGGQITFVTDDGFAANGIIDEKGHYTIKAPVGRVKISVNNMMLLTKREQASKGAGPRPGGEEPLPIKGTYVQIPNKVSTPDTSGLSYDVKPGQQTLNITISD